MLLRMERPEEAIVDADRALQCNHRSTKVMLMTSWRWWWWPLITLCRKWKTNRGTKCKRSKFKPIIATSCEKAMTARAEALFSTGQVFLLIVIIRAGVTSYRNYNGQVFYLIIMSTSLQSSIVAIPSTSLTISLESSYCIQVKTIFNLSTMSIMSIVSIVYKVCHDRGSSKQNFCSKFDSVTHFLTECKKWPNSLALNMWLHQTLHFAKQPKSSQDS